MTEHRYKVGDLVRVRANASLGPAEALLDAYSQTSTIGRASGIYEIVGHRPEIDGQHQYRIKGGEPPHECIAREEQLISASLPGKRRSLEQVGEVSSKNLHVGRPTNRPRPASGMPTP